MRCLPASRRDASRNMRYRKCPPLLVGHFWSAPVLRVLEKATQIRPDNRYQTVQEFWDDLADAAMPATKRLGRRRTGVRRSRKDAPSAELGLDVEPEEITEAPPQPRFEPVSAPHAAVTYVRSLRRRPTTEDCGAGSRDCTQSADRRSAMNQPPQTARDSVWLRCRISRETERLAVARSKMSAARLVPRTRARPLSGCVCADRSLLPGCCWPRTSMSLHTGILLLGLPLLSDVFVIGRRRCYNNGC